MAIQVNDVAHSFGVTLRLYYDDTTGIPEVDPKGNRYVDYAVVRVEVINGSRRRLAARVGGDRASRTGAEAESRFDLRTQSTRRNSLGGVSLVVAA